MQTSEIYPRYASLVKLPKIYQYSSSYHQAKKNFKSSYKLITDRSIDVGKVSEKNPTHIHVKNIWLTRGGFSST